MKALKRQHRRFRVGEEREGWFDAEMWLEAMAVTGFAIGGLCSLISLFL